MHQGLVIVATFVAGFPWLPNSMTASTSRPGDEVPKSVASAPPAQEDTTELHWYWKNGLRFETADKLYRFRLGGRIQFDAGWFSGDDLKDAGFSLDDGSEFRRARLYMSGELPGDFFFKAEYDFAGSISDADNRPEFTDVLVGKKNVVGSADLTAGHFKEPFGLERLIGANNLTFLERGLSDALVPKRNNGVMLSDTLGGEMGTWAVGGFRAGTDNAGFSSEDGGYAITARATVAPMYEEDGDRVVHLGAAYSRRDMEGARFRSRPEGHLVGNFVDTGTIDNDDIDLYGLELASVVGPFSAMAEYVQASMSGTTEADFSGWYVEASWFLTGEHRPYSRRNGTFGRVVPGTSAGSGGQGAWQLAARLSSLDLNDSGVAGGEMDDVTLGVNWYLNANTKIQLNYVLASVDDASIPVDDDASILMVRLHMDW